MESIGEDLNLVSSNDSDLVRLTNKILIDAYDQGASDIHIEPGIDKEDIIAVSYTHLTLPTIYSV